MPSFLIKITTTNHIYCYRGVIGAELINKEVSFLEQNINKNNKYSQKERKVHTH